MSEALQTFAATEPVATVLANEHVQTALVKLEEYQPILLQTVPPLVYVLLAHRLNSYLRRRRELQANSPEMVDFGLGGSHSSGSGGKKGFGEIEVQWGRERLRVALPPPNSPLSTLKSELYNMTGVPPDHQKLIYSGAVLKDDLATLATYDLIDAPPASSSSSTTSFWDNWSFTGNNKTRKLKRLVMLGDKDVARVLDRKIPIEEPPPEKVADDEVTLVKKIGDIVENSVREWEPKILQLESYLAERRSGAEVETDSAPVEAPNPRTAIWLSEVLLQSLLKLDSFDIPSGFSDARKERKAAVKSLQSALDRVDAYTSAKL